LNTTDSEEGIIVIEETLLPNFTEAIVESEDTWDYDDGD